MSRQAGDAGRAASRVSWQMALPLPLLLAMRYLRSARRDAYVSFLSLLATVGITLGVAALILVLGGLSGLQDFLRSDVLSRTPHLEIELPEGSDPSAVIEQLAPVDGVLEARRLLRGRGWLLTGGRATDVSVVGYEGPLPEFFPDASGEQPGLYVGDALSFRWGIDIGDLVDIVSPRPTLTPFGPQPRIHQQRLAGTFRTGRTEDREQRIALPLEVARRLFGDRQIRIELRTEGLEAALAVARRVAPLLPAGSRVQTWQDLNRGLFFALRLEKILMFVSVFLIVPVAAMALVTVLALLISSKRGEIGMLQAMGATPGELRRAFLVLGTLLGGLGLSVGTGLGVGGAWLLDHYRLISPPGGAYFIDHIPFLVEGEDLLAVVLCTALLTTMSTIYAAYRAASLRAVEALRL
ncbi:MAG: ABC transporter permease [bacterium]|nr:ABC transporter permease [bacterium]